MLADAAAGVTDLEPHSRADARLRAAHRGEPEAAIRAAVHRAVDHIEDWWATPDAASQARLVTASPLGPVPIGTYLCASAFHLAVTARDLIGAGAPSSAELDELGVVALVDSSGAVASRLRAVASIAVLTPRSRSARAPSTATGARSWWTTVT